MPYPSECGIYLKPSVSGHLYPLVNILSPIHLLQNSFANNERGSATVNFLLQ